MPTSRPNSVDPPPRSGSRAALILAAGGSSRMGVDKALLDWHGESLVRRAVCVALDSVCEPVFVVAGAGAERIATELRDLPVELITHAGWREGMGSTIAAGIAHIEAASTAAEVSAAAELRGAADVRGVVLLLCDQPFIGARDIDRLCSTHETTGLPMAACRFGEGLGPPACFDRALFPKLRALTGDRGAKKLLLEDRDAVAEVECPAAGIDVDTPEEYQRALAMNADEVSGELE